MTSKKLRIALVTNNYTPYSGGVVSSINAFADQLMVLGHEVRIVTLDFLGDKHNDPPHVIRIPSLFRFRWGKIYGTVPWRMEKNVFHVLQDFKPDVVHTQHPFLIGWSALRAARKLSVSVVFTYHTMYERYAHYVPFYQPFVRSMTTKIVLRFCESVDFIIAPSNAIRLYLREKKIETPLTIIPSPLLSVFFGTPVAEKKNEKGERFNLLLVSRFVKEKDIPFVLDVVSKLDQQKFQLTLVGYGQEEESLRAYAYQTLGFTKDQVKFLIQPPKQKLAQLYQESDLFLFSSTSDTQGLVLAEAMAGGTPVVAVDGPGQQDIIKNGKNGFIVFSQDQMVEKIRQISGNAQLYKKLQHGAYTTAQFYSAQTLANWLVQVYRCAPGFSKSV